jgi:hypothetical protein
MPKAKKVPTPVKNPKVFRGRSGDNDSHVPENQKHHWNALRGALGDEAWTDEACKTRYGKPASQCTAIQIAFLNAEAKRPGCGACQSCITPIC